jgi:UDP-N-acetylglucosamine--N-acetylmuramyl-(pentapeptide) pyrophosphoryl-undecaprenol N-acetylglucosamine transferase
VRFFAESARPLAVVSGNPVRSCFYSADPEKGRAFLRTEKGDRILLVLGGSQGADALNELVRAALPGLTRRYVVVHQYGPSKKWDIPASERYKPYPFIREEMPHILAAAELVLGRSGAGTVWESAALGKPMILIPLCGSGTRGDQVENARFFERAGAAMVLLGDEATQENTANLVNELAEDTARRDAMAQASKNAGSKNSAGFIAHNIIEHIDAGGYSCSTQ